MSSLKEYFYTDWAALTLHDWIGMIMNIAVLLLMIGIYVYVFHPKNKAKLESRRFPDVDDYNAEDK